MAVALTEVDLRSQVPQGLRVLARRMAEIAGRGERDHFSGLAEDDELHAERKQAEAGDLE